MKSTYLAIAITLIGASILAPARLAHADADEESVDAASAEPCETVDGLCDADAGAKLGLDDGVIHLDGATGDAAADQAAQSGCSTGGPSNGSSGSAWWLPLPFAAAITLAGRRRRRSQRRR